MGSPLDDLMTKAFEYFDRDLGKKGTYPRRGEVKYRLGKSYLERGRFGDAYVAFVQSESDLAEAKGLNHPWTISAIVRQAECELRLQKSVAACQDFRRALTRMVEAGHAGHAAARSISRWLRKWCK
jgi:hypothetical protein